MDNENLPTQITPDKILELEFNYIKETANQAIDDRYKLLNFYIGIATFVATLGIGASTISNIDRILNIQAALAVLCIIISIIGWIFVAMLVRLRQAWHESMRAMNQIKAYYLAKLPEPDLKSAFAWGVSTLPRKQRFWNIHFYSVLLIIIINSAFFGAGVLLAEAGAAIAIVATVGVFLGQIFWYRFSLAHNL